MKKVIITQSNYVPWKGYFNNIKSVDVFVVYDDMQYTKRDWRNRNLIKTPHGLRWLTIPVEVKGRFIQKIKDTKIADKKWKDSHWNILKENYKKAKCFKETSEWLEQLYRNCQYEFLTDINIHFISNICKILGINTQIRLSTDFFLENDKTERLVSICKEVGATEYYSGPSAKAYMDISKFESQQINVFFFDYNNYPVYCQLFGEFEHQVSILDLLMNEGDASIRYLKKTDE